MPLFVLSPASLAHSALFAGYYTYLSSNVIVNRLSSNIWLGSGDADKVHGPGDKKTQTPDELAKLQKAVRAHGNFAESAPFAFFLIFLAELNGAPTSLVHAAYTTLFAARVAHGSIGIQAGNGAAIGRPVGALVTLAVTLGAGLYNLNLGWEPLKSFLGFK
ncbi:Membrane-associated, eicosanoid/glutathione metabolism (MAPEG) protein [Kalmanozyma brasiliensis GHG001]|uniref:Membrane-associated proteins in eicosanoid and glutathione metabolism n=1 Tax=Kalmanozyma brasiliensis (strain GHG001) TaxID=1365824 RepID=V5F265_KALBG|nr:Membrane-associated, eicosanoid/glutathione metabolism (MAPEG) protein [Kalmanozyma brasiliensis GHG001]EST09469.1 Membrane-associated, eicosanoid/glutathione metabolism (MAPEG) protein [Kalmanozyma brasiliensis GHG001]